jgi:hypothetical protein
MRALVGIASFAVACTLAESRARAQAAPPAAAPAPARPPPTIVPPKLLSDPVVDYPEGASGEATIVLTLLIAADGSVQSAAATEANEPFSTRAEAEALAFRFEPALRDGKPVAAKIRLEIVFKPPPPEAAAEPGPESTTKPDREQPVAQEPIEITVQGVRPSPARSATLSRAEVRQLPGAFGDPFRALEAMPGVTPIVSGLPFFFVRGAPPGNVGYYLDGIRVPLLFHVGIGPSVIHPALVDRVDLYPGGYPARFGRFAGGIVSGETTAPERELHGEYNLRLFDAGALAEAPFAGGRGAALVGGRYSYTATLLSLVAPETTLEYWDYQARVGYELGADDRVSVFAFGSYDFLGQKTQAEALTLFGTEFHRADLRYDRRLGTHGKLRTALTVGLDRSRAPQQRFVRNRMAAARTELEYRVSRHALFRTGTDVQFDAYDVELGPSDLSPAAHRIARLFPSRTDRAWGLHGELVLDLGRLELTPGLRADVFASEGAGELAVDPRLAVRALVSENLSLLAAYGVAHQPPAFVVPLPGFQPGGLHGGLQRSLQESFGVEIALGGATTFTATVFQNSFFDMSDPLGSTPPELNGCPPGSFPDDSLAGDRGLDPIQGTPACGDRFPPGTLGPDRSGGGGQGADSRGGNRAASAFEVRTMGASRGLELLLKRRLTQKLGGFLAYTLSYSSRSYERRRYTATFDRTHVANAALAYDLGKNWRAGTRLVFYTGLPKATDPTDPEDRRLPPFFRLDLRLEKRWWITEKLWIAGVAEWMNATLSTEAVSTTCTLRGCEAQTIGPVTIPSLGLEGGF